MHIPQHYYGGVRHLALPKHLTGLALGLLTSAPPSTVEAKAAIVDMWSLGLGAVCAAIAGIILANTDYFLTKPEFASLEYLENAALKSTEGGTWNFLSFFHTSAVVVEKMKVDLVFY